MIQVIPLTKRFLNSKFLVVAFYLFGFVWPPAVCPPMPASLLLALPTLLPRLGKGSKDQISFKRDD